VHDVHAVDAAGVHPLLLVAGSERYTPYAELRRPQELLTQANAVLGQGQLSLAKYLFIAARDDAPDLEIDDIAGFLRHVLERFDPRRDLHFQTETTIDTLDYSGTGLNEGSKLIIAAVGPRRRELPTTLPSDPSELKLGDRFESPRVALPGVLVIRGPKFVANSRGRDPAVERFCERFQAGDPINAWPLVVVVDDPAFAAESLENFLWTTFTRSNPAVDVYGIGASIVDKHWGAAGSIVIDARAKPHHAPPLVEDPEVVRRVERLAVAGKPLHGIL
jgi:4-hydroxy-3-polyprenylbenzoate decarboxylase